MKERPTALSPIWGTWQWKINALIMIQPGCSNSMTLQRLTITFFMFYINSRSNIFQQIAEHFKEDKKIAHNWKAEIQLRILIKHFLMYLLTGGVCCSGNLWPSSSNNLWKMMPLCQPHPPPTKKIGKIEEKNISTLKEREKSGQKMTDYDR